MHRNSIINRLFQVTMIALVVATFIGVSNTATADDRADAKALVGKWKEQSLFLPTSVEFKGDGSYMTVGTWTVKNGKLVIKHPVTGGEYDFTLSPDQSTLTFNKRTWKRQ